MAKSGYVVFALRAHPRMRPQDHKQVADVDGRAGDVLRSTASVLTRLTGTILKNPRFQNALRIESVTGKSRWVGLTALFGPYGADGFLLDVEGTEDDGEFGENQARALEYRAMLVVPPASTVALLFSERRVGSHLRTPLDIEVFRYVQKHLGVMVKTSAHVDEPAWQRFLDRGTAHEVTEVWDSQRPEDYEANQRDAGRLKVTLSGAAAARRGRAIIAHLRQKLSGETTAVYNVDLPEVDVSDDEFKRRELKVQIDDGQDKRVVVIDSEDLPQWVYQLGDIPDTDVLFRAWQVHARSILSSYGVSLGEDWHVGPEWPADFLIPDIEVS